MFRPGPLEIALIVVIVLFIFGPRRLPELGRGVGQFIKNFKNSLTGGKEEKDSPADKSKE